MQRLLKGLALTALVCAHSAIATAQLDDVTIEATEITPSIYMLEGRGGNMAVCLGDDGAFLIDDQFAPLTEKIQAKVKELGGDEIRFVINTHWHGDHTGGNENLGKAGTLIVAHDNVRVRMSTENFSEMFNRTTPPSPEVARPVITFDRSVTFHLNGETIHAIHPANAHTDGDAILYFQDANVVHMGDTWFNGMYPFVDVDSGGSIDGLIAGIEQTLDRVDDETRIIPGHGPLGDRTDLQVYLTMLKDCRAAIQAAMKEHGDDLEAITATDPFQAYNDVWGQGFIKPDVFAKLLVRSLSD